ncbi:hypothetical protein P9112_013143 [Eukaryota sp. TZLM1-RC]
MSDLSTYSFASDPNIIVEHVAYAFSHFPYHSIESLKSKVVGSIGNISTDDLSMVLNTLVDKQVLAKVDFHTHILYTLANYDHYLKIKCETPQLLHKLENYKPTEEHIKLESQLDSIQSNIQKTNVKILKLEMDVKQADPDPASLVKQQKEVEDLKSLVSNWQDICGNVFNTVVKEFGITTEQACAMGRMSLEQLQSLGVDV